MKYKTRKNYWQQDIAKHESARAISQGILLITIVSYLFYGTVLYAILLSPYLIWYVKSWERQMIQKKNVQKVSVARAAAPDCYVSRQQIYSRPAVPMCA